MRNIDAYAYDRPYGLPVCLVERGFNQDAGQLVAIS
jgi:hypothetical protein